MLHLCVCKSRASVCVTLIVSCGVSLRGDMYCVATSVLILKDSTSVFSDRNAMKRLFRVASSETFS